MVQGLDESVKIQENQINSVIFLPISREEFVEVYIKSVVYIRYGARACQDHAEK